jgi:UDP-2,4-diacetamido-2,4,6-trideoxy-beta-L-altropyranose hydrolase
VKCLFRTDASLQIGTGHVMRCLTLADALRAAGVETVFVSRAHPGHMLDTVRARGHGVVTLPDNAGQSYGDHPDPPAHANWLGADWGKDAAATRRVLEDSGASWLVVDHYALDVSWQEKALPAGVSLLVIDDLADRPHRADVLLDQNFGRKATDYAGLASTNCALHIGPAYALLRPEFAHLRPRALSRREALSRPETLLVTLGGIDRDNVTCRVLNALAQTPTAQGLRIAVVMGDSAPHLEAVRARAATMPIPTDVVAGVQDMAQRMMMADLCIGAVGSTAWERCAMGLPTLQMVLADNQIGAAQAMAEQGVSLALPSPKAPDFVAALAAGLEHLSEVSAYRATVRAAAALTDGSGAVRLARTLLQRLADAH